MLKVESEIRDLNHDVFSLGFCAVINSGKLVGKSMCYEVVQVICFVCS